jgi:hemoglobin-like flavoprotein
MDEFYSRLFEAAPDVAPLFADTDPQHQKATLLGTLVLRRKSLRDVDRSFRSFASVLVTSPTAQERSTNPVVAEAAIAGPEWRSQYE